MFKRHRRLRQQETLRKMMREHHVQVNDLIYPLFLIEGEGIKREIPSMPGIFQYSLDLVREELHEIHQLGIPAIMLFGIPKQKDDKGSMADSEEGIVQKGLRYIKECYPSLFVISDTCLCQYTRDGHCGVIEGNQVENDSSLKRLVSIAVSQAKAGADMIAPSNMMDGFVYAIRKGLDDHGFSQVPILSYAVKYHSHFYGPFRDAADSMPQFGDRKSYQLDPANSREAMREAMSDVMEGADMIMVKPGLPYLDILSKMKDHTHVPVVAYQVSGEYAMIKAAKEKGWLNEKEVVLEALLSFKRAGADLIITYYAKDVVYWLKGEDTDGN